MLPFFLIAALIVLILVLIGAFRSSATRLIVCGLHEDAARRLAEIVRANGSDGSAAMAAAASGSSPGAPGNPARVRPRPAKCSDDLLVGN